MRLKTAFTGVASAAILVLMAEPCFACSCVPMEPQQQVDRAAVVFTGKVIDLKSETYFSHIEKKARKLLHRRTYLPPTGDALFDVTRVYKGNVHQTQWISGHGLGASCRYTFEPGRTYTVFAYMQDDEYLETGLCGGVYIDGFAPQDYGLEGYVSPIAGTDLNAPRTYATWFLAWAAVTTLVAGFFIVRAGVQLARRRFGSKADPSL